ncbi:thiamine diphosphokinase [Fusobacterium sp.]|uniref:thiamine diphosphokinase n=1 Tax=Fusobacterium sp. TaxID=68766 RepID=UPI0025C52956|nr:thiamine diphosphokinase [Fusobacterium sp.]MCI7223486.1 thiamine diphosphokinase [Fusobacterium sp.]
MKVAYVFFNGALLGKKEFYKNFIKNETGDVYCADGGANISFSLNIMPLEIWGDLDSIDENVLKSYISNGVKIKKFPIEKDNTDSELLINYLLGKKYEKIYCIAGLGGDIDHELTNLNLCFKYKNLYFLSQKNLIFSIDKNYDFKNMKNKKISFIIYSDRIKKLNLHGFKYEVDNLDLFRGDSRCMSNIISENNANINFESGKVLAILK